MTSMDFPLNYNDKQFQSAHHAEEHVSPWAEIACFFKDALKKFEGKDATGCDEPKTVQMKDHGQIKEMALPKGWVDGIESAGQQGTESFKEVHPKDAPDATLCFYYRGLPMTECSADTFKSILDKPPHVLSTSEIKSLSEVLRGKDNPDSFAAVMIKTEDLNGKRVLMVNGRLKDTQEDLQGVLVDADGSGKFVQEIYFQAPKDLYMRYNKEARQALKSIEWK
ncbi:MAG TPA: hypothetical protein V6C72_18235 [Chroococcales cyanobacterium]